MNKGLKRASIAIVALGLLLLAYVAAGPWLAIKGIRTALAERDAAALEQYVDFPALRVNLKAHLDDYILRKSGLRKGGDVAESGGFLGAIGLQIASGLGGTAVDAMVTPMGIGSLLQGHAMWKRAAGQTTNGDAYGPPQPMDPLKGAKTRFESTSRFTATVKDAEGEPVVAVFQRQGLHWRLADIRFEQAAR